MKHRKPLQTLCITLNILYVAFLFATIPYVRLFQELMDRKHLTGLYTPLVFGVLIIIVLLIAVYKIKAYRQSPPRFSLVSLIEFALLCALFVIGMKLVGHPVEKVHFLEYGVLVGLIYSSLYFTIGDRSIYLWMGMLSLGVGIADEWIQWYIPSRFGEIRDISINFIATLTVVLSIAWIVRPKSHDSPIHRKRIPGILIGLCCLLLELTFFIHCAHLGYLIQDSRIGEFKSHFTKTQLLERASTHSPVSIQPTSTQRKSRKDYSFTALRGMWRKADLFLIEAEFHSGERFRRLKKGDVVAALLENRLLMKYYRNLMLESPLRWSPSYLKELRSRLSPKARKSLKNPHYRSTCNEQLWTGLSPQALYAIWAALTMLLLTLAVKLKRPLPSKNNA